MTNRYAVLGPFYPNRTSAELKDDINKLFDPKIDYKFIKLYPNYEEAVSNLIQDTAECITTLDGKSAAKKFKKSGMTTAECIIVKLNKEFNVGTNLQVTPNDILTFRDFDKCMQDFSRKKVAPKTYPGMWKIPATAFLYKSAVKNILTDYVEKAGLLHAHAGRKHAKFMQHLHNELNNSSLREKEDPIGILNLIYQEFNKYKNGELNSVLKIKEVPPIDAEGSMMRRLNFIAGQLSNGEIKKLEDHVPSAVEENNISKPLPTLPSEQPNDGKVVVKLAFGSTGE